MKKMLIYILFIVLLSSCNNSSPPDEYFEDTVKQITSNSHKIITDNIKLEEEPELQNKYENVITNKNVKQKLNNYALNNTEKLIKIITSYGDIKIKLYEDTPLHRASFIMLIKKNYFDNTLFYRVIRNFIIQGGNSDNDNVLHKMAKIGNYKIPPEIHPHHIHKRGALVMAVQEQYFRDTSKHDKSSSPYNFYIVQRGPISNKYMDKLEDRYKIKINKKDREIYKKYGGNPHLDGDYTVFGEVYSGMKVVDKINKVLTDANDRPQENILISIEIDEATN